jgi:hypothetical protein
MEINANKTNNEFADRFFISHRVLQTEIWRKRNEDPDDNRHILI